MVKLTPGGKAWIGLTAYVVAYDAYAVASKNDTLSTAFYQSVAHPKKRWPVIVVWVYLTCHLFKIVPEKYDPLRRL